MFTRIKKRIFLLGALFVTGNMVLIANLAFQMKHESYAETAQEQSHITVTAGTADGIIYDRNFQPLVNRTSQNYAFVNPTPEAIAALLPYTREITPVVEALQSGLPFCCQVAEHATVSHPDILLLALPQRYAADTPAQHILGYTLEHTGITGLESDYEQILRAVPDVASVTYTVDARQQVLPGADVVISTVANRNAGVVTTLDVRIQELCERQEIEKGAIVVMDVQSGDILAMASFPDYSVDTLGEAISNPDSPLINRCLCAYNVGSVFKLMTCATAYTQHLQNFTAECTGSVQIKQQLFRCHDWNGHGILDMKTAMIYSCNSYFIRLSQLLQPALMRETAQNFGFGTQIALSESICSESGSLPSIRDLTLPAEMANFCFGQGLLTATPLQVTQMTCGIANNGNMPLARLVRGITEDGCTVQEERSPMYARALKRDAAYYLRDMMTAAINENENSNAVPATVFAAGKTSTAQTGRYDPDGQEYCHAWITGYFPLEQPAYAITVLVEDGGYGNDAAAPIFQALADAITSSDVPQAEQSRHSTVSATGETG